MSNTDSIDDMSMDNVSYEIPDTITYKKPRKPYTMTEKTKEIRRANLAKARAVLAQIKKEEKEKQDKDDQMLEKYKDVGNVDRYSRLMTENGQAFSQNSKTVNDESNSDSDSYQSDSDNSEYVKPLKTPVKPMKMTKHRLTNNERKMRDKVRRLEAMVELLSRKKAKKVHHTTHKTVIVNPGYEKPVSTVNETAKKQLLDLF